MTCKVVEITHSHTDSVEVIIGLNTEISREDENL